MFTPEHKVTFERMRELLEQKLTQLERIQASGGPFSIFDCPDRPILVHRQQLAVLTELLDGWDDQESCSPNTWLGRERLVVIYHAVSNCVSVAQAEYRKLLDGGNGIGTVEDGRPKVGLGDAHIAKVHTVAHAVIRMREMADAARVSGTWSCDLLELKALLFEALNE